MPKKTEPREPAPLLGPLTEAEWRAQTIAAMLKSDASPEVKADYARMLETRPALSEGEDFAVRARQAALKPYTGVPILAANATHRLKLMRAELAGPAPSPLESLLIDVICSAYQDYWEFSAVYKHKNAKEFTLNAMEQWERILSAKEARYERAIETLARVRRLLKLPGAQVNINLPGGQQVNMQGSG